MVFYETKKAQGIFIYLRKLSVAQNEEHRITEF
jgi:hypothetical protein